MIVSKINIYSNYNNKKKYSATMHIVFRYFSIYVVLMSAIESGSEINLCADGIAQNFS